MMITWELALLGVVAFWATLSYIYWRHWVKLSQSKFHAYDMIFLTAIFGFVLARLAAVVIDYSLVARPFSVRQLFTFSDLNFNYLILAFVPMLAYQFFSFNIQLNRKWAETTLAPILVGMLSVIPLAGLQIFRGVMLDWPSQFLIVHGLVIAVCIAVCSVAYFIWRKGLLLRLGYLAYVLYSLGIGLSYFFTAVLSREEWLLNVYVLAFFTLITFIPYISYSFVRRRAADHAQA